VGDNEALRFPPGFLWGTATAAHQVEGGNSNNDWWAWEEAGRIKDGSRSGGACDWWHRAEEDFDRAQAMGQNSHRLSVEWSRIEPEQGHFDRQAIERYRQMLTGLRERNLSPMVTLHHFTNPLWLSRMGAWENPAVIPLFTRFASKVVEELGDLCSLWCTINEPVVYTTQGYIRDVWPPGRSNFALAWRVLNHMVKAHAQAYRAIHRLASRVQVGLVKHMRILDPANLDARRDRGVAALQDYIFNWLFLDAVTKGRLNPPLGLGGLYTPAIDSVDFIGLNYYARDALVFDRKMAGNLFGRVVFSPEMEMGPGTWGEIYPQGLYRLIKRLESYRKPVYITESGRPDNTDADRPRFILTHLAAMQQAMTEGAPVKGYYHWTLIDNFEWAEGWSMRFGLIALDEKTRQRTVKRSGELYSEICRANAITADMVQRYAPEVYEQIFPPAEV
jgi:beta-glucosidase